MIRHADLIRNYVRDNVLTTYFPSVKWDESDRPFTDLTSKIVYCRQEGLAVDAFVRQVSVDIYLFSKQGANSSDMNALYDDAVTALEYLKANPNVDNGGVLGTTKISVTSDVTGEFYTGQNRLYYRFSIMCMSD